MALQFLEEAAGSDPRMFSGKDSRAVLLDNFVCKFAGRVRLRHSPEGGDFCPFRATAMIAEFLRQVSMSLFMLKIRVCSMLACTRKIQAWIRFCLRTRAENFQQILDRWVTTHTNHKKALQAELYRDSWLCPKTVRYRLRAYTKLHNSEDAMRAAVEDLYWEKRLEFQQQFHSWFVNVRALRVEQEQVKGLLRRAKAGGAGSVPDDSSSFLSGSSRPSGNAAVMAGTLQYRLATIRGELAQLQLQRPTFHFSVKTVALSELMKIVGRPRPLVACPERSTTSSSEGMPTPTHSHSGGDSGRSAASVCTPQAAEEGGGAEQHPHRGGGCSSSCSGGGLSRLSSEALPPLSPLSPYRNSPALDGVIRSSCSDGSSASPARLPMSPGVSLPRSCAWGCPMDDDDGGATNSGGRQSSTYSSTSRSTDSTKSSKAAPFFTPVRPSSHEMHLNSSLREAAQPSFSSSPSFPKPACRPARGLPPLPMSPL
eukprot:RCo027800